MLMGKQIAEDKMEQSLSRICSVAFLSRKCNFSLLTQERYLGNVHLHQDQ